MRERALRAIAECRQIATMTEEPGRITRRFLSPPMHQVHDHLRTRMQSMGMTTSVDAAGNLRGLSRSAGGTLKHVILGSHIDTVPDAGAFDGVLGVALALEWVGLARELEFPLAIEIIAFSDEEGVRFGVPFLGSRAAAGSFDPALFAIQDSKGITVEAAIREFGLDPGEMGKAVLGKDAIGFVEIHIEQGPVLEASSCSVAAVSAIVGQTRINLEFRGHANHAGTTPMHLRQDALAATAEWIVAVEALARNTEGLVATVGKINVEPNVGNVVPGVAQVSLEVRNADDSVRAAAVGELLESAASIANRRGITLERKNKLEHPAVPMDERLTGYLTEAIEAVGLPARTMISGAGHDAMVMAARVPTAMLFLRSPGGISHHHDESVLEEDVEASLRVGHQFLLRLAKQYA
jgi:allantoate deiminase